MPVLYTIFIVSFVITFGLLYRSWRELKAGKRAIIPQEPKDISYRTIEKYVLYYGKNFAQILVINVVKYSLIFRIKAKKLVLEKWPSTYEKIKNIGKGKSSNGKPSFLAKAILESKTKIRRIKDKVRKEHEENI